MEMLVKKKKGRKRTETLQKSLLRSFEERIRALPIKHERNSEFINTP
jgi:hypothetical protein